MLYRFWKPCNWFCKWQTNGFGNIHPWYFALCFLIVLLSFINFVIQTEELLIFFKNFFICFRLHIVHILVFIWCSSKHVCKIAKSFKIKIEVAILLFITGHTSAIIYSSFTLISQSFICFIDFNILSLSIRCLVNIWVILFCQFEKGFFDFVLSCCLGNA